MTFEPDEDAELIADVAERFLQDSVDAAPGGRVPANDAALWSSMAEMGWLGLPLPVDAGGLDDGGTLLGVIAQALGRAGVVQPFIANAAIPLLLLKQSGDARASELAAMIASGARRAAFVHGTGIRAAVSTDGVRLDGTAPLIAGGATADVLLVLAEEDDDRKLFLIDIGTAGIDRSRVETIDGSDMADIAFRDVPAGTSLVGEADAGDLSESVADVGALLLCAEAVGIMEALVAETASYTATRQQFGKPLRAFQAVEHALSDMLVALEESRTIVRMGLLRADGSPAQRRRSVCGAIAKVGHAGRLVSHNAIQFHGAMGVTEELRIGALAKRLIGLRCTLPGEEAALDQYGVLVRSGDCWSYLGQPGGNAAVFAEQALVSFRHNVADWLDTHLDPEIARAQQLTTMVYLEAETARRWHNALHARGWAAPNWPSGYGGTGWSAFERYIWAHESGARFAPITSPLGLPLVGPVLFHFGTEAQQKRFLPPIVAGEELWCQGFSEPGAGSDLAALATRARREGDHYVVNGTKIWTTQGHEADMMAALVRTGAPGSRREGISFLLIDMKSPGIEIRPIETIGGDHELNQIFFDEVRVPAGNLIGSEGQGWEIAKFLLEYERGGDIMSAAQRALLRDIDIVAVGRGQDDAIHRRKVASVAIAIDTLEAMELFTLTGTAGHPALPSILKLRASEIQQAVTELGVDVLGADAIRSTAVRPLHSVASVSAGEGFVPRYLNSRANTIFGGAREIQKTLIAKALP